MKKIILFVAFLLLIPTLALGASFQGGEELTIPEPLNDDLYGVGGVVRVAGSVAGDAVLMGGAVSVAQTIEQDLLAFGGEVDVHGTVNGDARIVAGQVTVDAAIGDDLTVVAGKVTVREGAVIQDDLIVGAGELTLLGRINGDLEGGVESVYINGPIEGNVRLYSVKQLTFGPKGQIFGVLTYSRREPIETLPAVKVIGGIEYKPFVLGSPEGASDLRHFIRQRFSVMGLLTTLFAGLLLVWLFKFYTLRLADLFHHRPLKSLGVGFLTLVAAPILALLLLIITIGWPVSLILIATLLILLYLGKLAACMALGTWLARVDDKTPFVRHYLIFILGALIYTLLGLIPFAGPPLQFLLVLAGLGAVALYEWEIIQTLRKKKMV